MSMLPNALRGILEYTPFLCMLTMKPGDDVEGHDGAKRLTVRLMEAGIVAGIVLWGTVEVLGVRMNHIEASHAAFREEVREDLKDIRNSITDLVWRIIDDKED